MIFLISVLVSAGSVGIMWLYMCRVSADRNGWFKLAERYRLQEPFEGTRYGLQSAIFNGFAFTGTLNLGVTERGLYLRGGLLLRAFHPALVIPWQELGAGRFERSHTSGYALTFAPFPEMSCELSDATIQRLDQGIRREWSVSPPWRSEEAS